MCIILDSIEHRNNRKLIKILDWFHIDKKFKERESKIPEELKEHYKKAKRHC